MKITLRGPPENFEDEHIARIIFDALRREFGDRYVGCDDLLIVVKHLMPQRHRIYPEAEA